MKITKEETQKKILIEDILIVCKANNVYTDGDLFFSLAFMPLVGLKKMAKKLNIKIK